MAAVVETTYGKLQGVEQDGLQVFKGIRFAAPPVGERRWLAPEKPETWQGVREANSFAPISPQTIMPTSVFGAAREAEPQDEDCLYLNVWTPGTDDARRPVMVWIHGGAFRGGSGSSPMYDGAALAKRDVVLVSVNYRLAPFGFLRLADVTGGLINSTGNEGLLDQVAALEWVRDNIAAFGGDPGNVTIFGESAGGMSVGALLALPAAKGLFHKAIPQSGASNTAVTKEQANYVAERMLSVLGLAGKDIEQLRAVTAEQLVDASNKLTPVGGPPDPKMPGMPLQPVVDLDVLPRLPIEAVAAGSAAGIPLLVGSILEEWKLFSAMDPNSGKLDADALRRRVARQVGEADADRIIEVYRAAREARGESVAPPELFSAIETDRMFRAPAVRLLETQRAHEDKVYGYLVTWASPTEALGACHAIELGFVFGTHASEGMADFFGTGPEADALAQSMGDAWVAFARTGDPSSETTGAWPAYDPARRATMVFGRTSGLEDAPYDAERAAWADVPDGAIGKP